MGLRQCEKCNEMVDEAKAFCPGCGNSFVAEAKRESVSNFDTFEGTVKLGDTMYNQMLTDMGLNISKAPDSVEKRVEVIAPAATEAKPVAEMTPAAVPVAAKPENAVVEAKPASKAKWFIIGGVILVFLFAFIIAAAALVVVYLSYK